ncbi:hypothetical protein [Streptomyces sp. NPDC020747]|uniref:hypothetical protein n=1 Tax=Streptomyces sp. NPDC020747 TaxID=3365086 RepID=UPI003794E654
MTTPIDPADVVAKVIANIREEQDKFFAALAKDVDAPAYVRNWLDGQTAIVTSVDHIRILPFTDCGPDPDDPDEPDDTGTGHYL